MTTPRKPRPDLVDRATVEAMIAEAVQAEQARGDRAMAGLLEAVGSVSAKLDVVAGAVADVEVALDTHAGLLRPLCEAFAAASDMADAVATIAETVN